MEKILAKRLIFLTKIYIVALALSLLSLLNNYDSKDLSKDLRAINLIEDTGNRINVPRLYAKGEIQKGARKWLNKHDPALWESNRQVREVITQHLIKKGTSIDDLEKVKGVGRFRSQYITFSLIDVPNIMASPASDDESERDEINETGRLEVKTIDDLIEKFTSLCKPVEIVVATSIDQKELNKIEVNEEAQIENAAGPGMSQGSVRSRPNEPAVGGATAGVRFGLTSVLLKRNVIEVLFTEDIGYASQKVPEEKRYNISAGTQKVSGNSLLSLITETNQLQDQLYRDSNQIRRLSSLYGRFSPEISKNIVTEDLFRAYKGIELLGFNFSTRRFPFGILLFNLLASIGIFWIVKLARSRSINILSAGADEDVTDILINSSLFRTILWVIVPSLAVWITIPIIPLGSVETAILYIGMIVLFSMGLASLFQSKTL